MDQSIESPSEALWRLIKDIRFAMFTTRHPNGHLHSRPMTTQNTSIEANDSLWFFMSHKGSPVGDLNSEPEVNVVYARVMGAHKPARAIVPVNELHYGYQIEIQAIAAVA